MLRLVLLWACEAWRWFWCWLRLGSKVFNFHNSSLRQIHGCVSCARLHLPGELIWQCSCCREPRDLCSSCVSSHRSARQPKHIWHPEIFPLSVDPAPLAHAQSVAEAVDSAFRLYSKRACLGWRCRSNETFDSSFTWRTYENVGIAAHNIGTGLRNVVGRDGSPFVGVLGSVCYAWLVADIGCLLKGLAVVLMHRATSIEQLASIIERTRMSALVVSRFLLGTVRQALKLTGRRGVKKLQALVVFEDHIEAHPTAVPDDGPRLELATQTFDWDELHALGAASPESERKGVAKLSSPSKILKLLPSSGSTGMPKLVVLTDDMLLPSVRAASAPKGGVVGGLQPTLLCYEVMRQSHDLLFKGGRIGFFSGSLGEQLLEDAQILRPTVFGATPAFWNTLHRRYMVERQSKAMSSVALMESWCTRKILGNRVQVLISTGAPLAHPTRRWLFRVFGRPVVDGYGTTETGGLSCNNQISPSSEIRLLDRPDLGYTTSDTPNPRGEILAKTARMAKGYFALEGYCFDTGTLKQGALGDERRFISLGDDIWFRTGDVGELLSCGQIRVIDRATSCFKLAAGVFVSPASVETILEQSDCVVRAFVWASSAMQRVGAVIVPADPKANVDIVRRALHAICIDNGLKPWEIPQRIILADEPFSEFNGLLSTGGSKLCRPALIARYRALLVPEDDHGVVAATDHNMKSLVRSGLCDALTNVLLEIVDFEGASPDITPDTPIVSLGLDSFALAQLSSRLGEKFSGLTLPPRAIYALGTLGNLERVLFGGNDTLKRITTLQRKCRSRGWMEAIVAEEVDVLAKNVDKGATRLSCQGNEVLLTGATGFLGAFLLHSLALNKSFTRVVCLVRATSDDAARDRLDEVLIALQLPPLDDNRVDVVAGDLTEPYFGLSVAAFRKLAFRLSLVVHNAANVSFAHPFEGLRESNVGGTRTALEIALNHRTRFVFVSTMGFLPPGHPESELALGRYDEGDLALRSGYAQSKFAAECLVHAVSRRYPDLPVLIFRPGQISGSAKSGASNRRDSVSMLLAWLAQDGIVCTSAASPLPRSFNLCPVDFVACTIVRILAKSRVWERRRIYHLCAERNTSLEQLVDWVKEAGFEIKEIGADDFCLRVRGLSETSVAFQLKATLGQTVEVEGTTKLVKKGPQVVPCAKRALEWDDGDGLVRNAGSNEIRKSLSYLLSLRN